MVTEVRLEVTPPKKLEIVPAVEMNSLDFRVCNVSNCNAGLLVSTNSHVKFILLRLKLEVPSWHVSNKHFVIDHS